ncbi:MAG: hypothetical protein ABII64_03035 [Elusimicrobiota bacterium]
MKRCHKCGAEWTGLSQPGAKESCAKCSADLHACLNCRFYNPHKPQECAVDVLETVRDKERFNFCDEFQFADAKKAAEKSDAQKAKDALNKLFKI